MNPDLTAHLAWRAASDAEQVHRLLCASDAFHAVTGHATPNRNPHTAERHVHAKAVQGLYFGEHLVGMVTLTDMPPHGMDPADFGPPRRALYMQRLAVDPSWLACGSLVGVRCVSRALEIARKRNLEVVRAEANPGLISVLQLLLSLGFVQVGVTRGPDNGAQRANLQRELPTSRD